MKLKLCLVVLIVVCLLSFRQALAHDAAKSPIPAEAVQAEATKLVKEVYGDEWAAAKSSTEKQALAKKLLGKADETTDDPVARFVLLRLARDIATQAGDGQTAFQAIDAMAKMFQVDPLEMKIAVLTKGASTAQKPAHHKVIAGEALKLADQAVSEDNFTAADKLGKLALAEARRAADNDLVTEAQRRITKSTDLAKAYEDVKAARLTVEKTPDDPEANLAVGKYLCFVKGDWDRGLPMLALGKDEALKALAKQEMDGAASSTEQATLGDGWWSLAEKQEGTAKKQTQGRAGYWYQKALPGLSGLMQAKVEKRMKGLEQDDSKARTDIDVHAQQPNRYAVPVKPQNNVQIVVADAKAFNEKLAKQFPVSQNKARDGVLEASSKERNWGPKEAFSGSRTGQGCNLGDSNARPSKAKRYSQAGSQGSFIATWAKPPMGRYILIFARTESGGGKGSDAWATATVSVNGGRAMPMLGMACQTVAVIDLGQIASIQRIVISIRNGGQHPGLVGLEIYEGNKGTK
jgi:hypothetical protein